MINTCKGRGRLTRHQHTTIIEKAFVQQEDNNDDKKTKTGNMKNHDITCSNVDGKDALPGTAVKSYISCMYRMKLKVGMNKWSHYSVKWM